MDFQISQEFVLHKHKQLLKVTKFTAAKVSPLWTYRLSSYRDSSIYALHLRVVAWLHSLRKLDTGVDIQPITAGVRALLETTTDLILLYFDKTTVSGWRMNQWGESAKLKSAKATIKYFNTRTKNGIPNSYQPMIDFVENNEDSIRHMRKQLGWVETRNPNKDRHPERWTNRPTLLDDIKAADDFHGSIIERHFGSNLEHFYETEYRRLNWNVHGSGFAGMSNADAADINIMCGFGYFWSAKLALVSAEIILRELKDRGTTGEIDNVIAELEYISVNLK